MANPSFSTRRSALRGLALFGLAGVSPAVASQPKTQSPQERMAFHLSEFKRAAQEADPSIRWWKVNAKPHGGKAHLAFSMEAHRVRCRYQGDGFYYINNGGGGAVEVDAYAWTPRVLVERAGEHQFLVTDDHSIPWGGRVVSGQPKSRIVTCDQLESVLELKDGGACRHG